MSKQFSDEELDRFEKDWERHGPKVALEVSRFLRKQLADTSPRPIDKVEEPASRENERESLLNRAVQNHTAAFMQSTGVGQMLGLMACVGHILEYLKQSGEAPSEAAPRTDLEEGSGKWKVPDDEYEALKLVVDAEEDNVSFVSDLESLLNRLSPNRGGSR